MKTDKEYKEDLKLMAHEFVAQGEFNNFNEAYTRMCSDFDKWNMRGLIDFFMRGCEQNKPMVCMLNGQNYHVVYATGTKPKAPEEK